MHTKKKKNYTSSMHENTHAHDDIDLIETGGSCEEWLACKHFAQNATERPHVRICGVSDGMGMKV